jgi:hypothetical protein
VEECLHYMFLINRKLIFNVCFFMGTMVRSYCKFIEISVLPGLVQVAEEDLSKYRQVTITDLHWNGQLVETFHINDRAGVVLSRLKEVKGRPFDHSPTHGDREISTFT